jgi:hypothetical protein
LGIVSFNFSRRIGIYVHEPKRWRYRSGWSPKDGDTDLGALLPKEINGWSVAGEDKLFDTETIFDYINGAGEIYRAYNFRSLLARQYSREGQPNIIADLFDMGSAKDAYGIFSHSLEEEDVSIGQGATYMGGLLSFWKDRFFVSLYAEEETEEAKEALFSLAKEVAVSIKDEGQIPDIISFFPPENLDRTNKDAVFPQLYHSQLSFLHGR